ncbi:MAG: hypothetical protein K6E73_06525 [Bacteroidales bacterium]|nr:hypothetical protein [Bacteroidales bacterium]
MEHCILMTWVSANCSFLDMRAVEGLETRERASTAARVFLFKLIPNLGRAVGEFFTKMENVTQSQIESSQEQVTFNPSHYVVHAEIDVPLDVLKIENENEQIESVFHYTSMKALTGILKNDDICLWAGRFDCQNDLNEFEAAKEISKIDTNSDPANMVYPYIISFSRNEDDLNIWRLYHSKVSLEINLKTAFTPYSHELKNGEPTILVIAGPCQYYYSNENLVEKYEEIKGKLPDAYKSELRKEPIQEALSLLKKGTYSYENEYRISISDHNPESNSGDGHFKDIEVFGRDNGNLLFYKKLYFPKKALKSITVFEPNELQFERIEQNLEFLLKYNGYEDVKIKRTKHQFAETH